MITNKHALLTPGAKTEWETPSELFEPLDAEFVFTLDVAASHDNALCQWDWTAEDDGLKQPWGPHKAAWCNPPYGPGIGRWLAKAAEERLKGVTTVCLLPARTDTKWWHEWVWDKSTHHTRTGVEVRFLKGRVRFLLGGKPAPAGSTFPSVIVVFRGIQ